MPKPRSIKEPTPPKSLISLQTWMAQAVSAPLEKKIDFKKASQFITESKNQSSEERLQIYTQDYWPRCFEALEEDFPLLYAFIGEKAFEDLITRYLNAYPSSFFTLFHLGENLSQFITQNPPQNHTTFIQNLIHYEWAKSKLFFAEQYPPFSPSHLTETQKKDIMSLTLKIQSSTTAIACQANFSVWKVKPNKLPKLRPIYLALYRDTSTFQIKEDVINYPIFRLLQAFTKPISLEAAVEEIWPDLEQIKPTIPPQKLQQWMGEIIQKGWLQPA